MNLADDSVSVATSIHRGFYAVGTDAGGGPRVRVFDAVSGAAVYDFFAFEPAFTGGVRVAVGDVTGDGTDDVIAAAGAGGGPRVRVFDGSNGAVVRDFFAFGSGFTGGVYVAAGDVDDDGLADIIVGAGAGGGPHVRVFGGNDNSILRNFFAFDSSFGGGVRVAAGDVNGDDTADIVTAAGPVGGPHVRVFDGASGAVLRDFFAFDPSFSGGIFVAAGDTDGDGRDDVVVGAGPGQGAAFADSSVFRNTSAFDADLNAADASLVRVFAGADATLLRDFTAYGTGFAGGVRVGAADANGDGLADILAGAGPGGAPHVRFFDSVSSAVIDDFFAFEPLFKGGIFVGT